MCKHILERYTSTSKGRSLILDSGGPASTSWTENLHHRHIWRYLLRLQSSITKNLNKKPPTYNVRPTIYSLLNNPQKETNQISKHTKILAVQFIKSQNLAQCFSNQFHCKHRLWQIVKIPTTSIIINIQSFLNLFWTDLCYYYYQAKTIVKQVNGD